VQRENGASCASVPEHGLARLDSDHKPITASLRPGSSWSRTDAMTRRRAPDSTPKAEALQLARAANFLAGAADERSESGRA
jgi:hypothetical protein